mgnify:CR=1 FL=1
MNLQSELTRLLALETTSEAEQKLLRQAQRQLTATNDVHIAETLKLQLSLMAVKQQLSKAMVDFLIELETQYRGMGQRGMGLIR